MVTDAILAAFDLVLRDLATHRRASDGAVDPAAVPAIVASLHTTLRETSAQVAILRHGSEASQVGASDGADRLLAKVIRRQLWRPARCRLRDDRRKPRRT